MPRGGGAGQDVDGCEGRKVASRSRMYSWGVALDVEATVPHAIDFGVVWEEFQRGENSNFGPIANGGHSASVEGGGGGEELVGV